MKTTVIDDQQDREDAYYAAPKTWNGQPLYPLTVARENYFRRIKRAYDPDNSDDSTAMGALILLWLLTLTPAEIVQRCGDAKDALTAVLEWSEEAVPVASFAAAIDLVSAICNEGYAAEVETKPNPSPVEKKRSKPTRSGNRGS